MGVRRMTEKYIYANGELSFTSLGNDVLNDIFGVGMWTELINPPSDGKEYDWDNTAKEWTERSKSTHAQYQDAKKNIQKKREAYIDALIKADTSASGDVKTARDGFIAEEFRLQQAKRERES